MPYLSNIYDKEQIGQQPSKGYLSSIYDPVLTVASGAKNIKSPFEPAVAATTQQIAPSETPQPNVLSKLGGWIKGDPKKQKFPERLARGASAFGYNLAGGLQQLGEQAIVKPKETTKAVGSAIVEDLKLRLTAISPYIGRPGTYNLGLQADPKVLESQKKLLTYFNENPAEALVEIGSTVLAGAQVASAAARISVTASKVIGGVLRNKKVVKALDKAAKSDAEFREMMKLKEAAIKVADEQAGAEAWGGLVTPEPTKLKPLTGGQMIETFGLPAQTGRKVRPPSNKKILHEVQEAQTSIEPVKVPVVPVKKGKIEPVIESKPIQAKPFEPVVEPIVSTPIAGKKTYADYKVGDTYKRLEEVRQPDGTMKMEVKDWEVDWVHDPKRPHAQASDAAYPVQLKSKTGGQDVLSPKQITESKSILQQIEDAIVETRQSKMAGDLKENRIKTLEALKKKEGKGESVELGVLGTPGTISGMAKTAGGIKKWYREKIGKVHTSLEGRFKSDLGKEYVKDMGDVWAREGNLVGTFADEIHKPLLKLSRKDRDLVGEALLANKVPDDPKLASAYNAVQSINNKIADMAEKLVPKFKRRTDFGMAHRLKPEIAEKLRTDMRSILKDAKAHLEPGSKSDKVLAGIINKRMKQLDKNLSDETKRMFEAASRNGMSAGDAVITLRNYQQAILYKPFGSFHYQRKLNFPVDFFDTDAARVAMNYIQGASKEIALVEKFGGNLEGFKKFVTQLEKVSEFEAQEARRAMRTYSGALAAEHQLSGMARKVQGTFGGFTYGTLLTVKSTLVQATQPLISFMKDTGWINSAKALTNIATKSTRANIRKSGVTGVATDVIHSIRGAAPRAGVTTAERIADNVLKAQGFTGANKLLQWWAGASYERYIQKLYGITQGKGILSKVPAVRNARKEWAIETLKKEYGVDTAKPLSDRALQEGIFRGVQNSQHQRNVMKDPGWFNDPYFKDAATLQRFNFRQAKYIKDTTIQQVKLGNIIPLLRLMAGGLIGGEGFLYLKNKFRSLLRGEPVERYDREIKQLMKDPKVKDILHHAFTNFCAVGALGALGDVGRGRTTDPAEFTREFTENMARLVLPPQASIVMNVAEEGQMSAVDVIKILAGEEEVGEVLKQRGPAIAWLFGSTTGDIASRGRTEEAKVKGMKRQLKPLEKSGYDDLRQERLAGRMKEFSIEAQGGLVEQEYRKARREVYDLWLGGDKAAARKRRAAYEKNFPAGPNIKLTPKEILAYKKRKRKQEEGKPTKQRKKIEQRLKKLGTNHDN